MRDFVDTSEAAARAKRTPQGILVWLRPDRYGSALGVKVGGRWRIYADALDTILEGGDPRQSSTASEV